MDHRLMFNVEQWIRGKRKMLRSKLALVLLIVLNFANITILSAEQIGTDSPYIPFFLISHLLIVMVALSGLYLERPVFLVPNIIAKLIVASISLFIGLQLAESEDPTNVSLFIWLIITLLLSVWEMQTQISAAFAASHRLERISKPPPTYGQVIEEESPPPSYEEALRSLDVSALSIHIV